MRLNRGSRPPRRLAQLQESYRAACDGDDHPTQLRVLETITAEFPEVPWPWYDLGLRYKWRREWPASRAANLRALEMLAETRGSPEAWNLGIAATALGDWATARRAWSAFGITLPDGSSDKLIEGDFGVTPVRLNPDPRFDEPRLELDGRHHETEVVWTRRICPARARIISVPLPQSGHRFGDTVLHDGDPVGHRRFGETERSVFNEIARLEPEQWSTSSVIVDRTDPGALDELVDAFSARGYAVEPWTLSVELLCTACSEGTPGRGHVHPPGTSTDNTVTLGVAAPIDTAERLLDEWLTVHGLRRGPLLPADH